MHTFNLTLFFFCFVFSKIFHIYIRNVKYSVNAHTHKHTGHSNQYIYTLTLLISFIYKA